MVLCARCQHELDGRDPGVAVASISASIQGDECTETYYLCPACGFYTVEIFWDCFDGEETSSLRGPVPRAEGDAQAALIRRCATPWDKQCRCDAHRAYWGDSL